MGKRSFNTLFSRMISTYLAIILLIIFLLGITISGMFKSQYMTENENELRREAAEINRVIVTQYVDAEKRTVVRNHRSVQPHPSRRPSRYAPLSG